MSHLSASEQSRQQTEPATVSIRNTSKLAFVDELRGIAILMVMTVHVALMMDGLNPVVLKLAKFGQMGVQLFFVASAYTLCLSHDRRSSEPNRLATFYLRRFFRIAPLYYFAIVLYCGQFWLQHSTDAVAADSPFAPVNIISHILLIHGVVPSAINAVVPGGWSIGTEMAFYAIFPFLFWIAATAARKNILLLAGIVLISLILNNIIQYLLRITTGIAISNSFFCFWFLPNQLPVFCIGMAAYFLQQHARAQALLSSKAIALSGTIILLGISIALTWWSNDLIFQIIPVTCALGYFFFLFFLKGLRASSTLLCRIGQVSYSMYILHFLVIWIIEKFAGRFFDRIDSHVLLPIVYLAVAAATLCLALLTEKTIEQKGIRLGTSIISRIRVPR